MTPTHKPWQEPMVWLMAGIPMATVIAGLYTFYLAWASGPMDSVPVAVQRIAQSQTLVGMADRTASQGHYRGDLLLEQQTRPWQLHLKTTPEQLTNRPVEVLFVHAHRAERDVRVRLESGQGQLSAALDFIPQQIVVTDVAGHWRLVGRYGSSASIPLTPAIPSP